MRTYVCCIIEDFHAIGHDELFGCSSRENVFFIYLHLKVQFLFFQKSF